ncbi:MAG TPA: hypothetical protein PK413_05270 [Thermoanaerobaculia bacterium]|nr:hypothetical protein [Thermoanaerobaculia bacterium]
MLYGLVIFVAFTALAVGGAYWIGAATRSRRAGLLAALFTFLAFVTLGWGVLWLIRSGLEQAP